MLMYPRDLVNYIEGKKIPPIGAAPDVPARCKNARANVTLPGRLHLKFACPDQAAAYMVARLRTTSMRPWQASST